MAQLIGTNWPCCLQFFGPTDKPEYGSLFERDFTFPFIPFVGLSFTLNDESSYEFTIFHVTWHPAYSRFEVGCRLSDFNQLQLSPEYLIDDGWAQ